MLNPENEATPADRKAGATPEVTMKPDPIAADPIQEEPATTRIGLIDKLTDIPAVARYASRIGAVHRSLKRLAVVESEGKYQRDLAVIDFADNGAIAAPVEFAPTDGEAAAITAEWSRYRRPEYQPHLYTGRDLPVNDPTFPWSLSPPDDVAVCMDAEGKHILCVEVRCARDDGGKNIYIWSPFEDGKWRIAEPPDGLPIFGLEQANGAAAVMIHEGPKCAKAARRIAADCFDADDPRLSHPWRDELRGAGGIAHIAFLGGALRAGQTRWADLDRLNVASVTMVCDRDQPGEEAVIPVSRELRRLDTIIFDDRFPAGFDIAEPLPASMFEQVDGQAVWRGPRLADLRTNATWATRRVMVPDNPERSHFIVRDEFAEGWFYIKTPGVFVTPAQPRVLHKPRDFNIAVRHISDLEETDRAFFRRHGGKLDEFAYAPGEPTGVITTRNGMRAFNLHRGSGIKPVAGDWSMFEGYLDHLIPVEPDRFEVKRWIATLIACPGRRVKYGLILASDAKGIGKSWLTEKILSPVLGRHNVGFPTEAHINDKYTDWYVEKRLVAIEEVKVGDKRQFSDKLKAPVTQDEVAVRKMYLSTYYLDNHAHFIITSNDDIPMPIERGDRRWLIPAVTEEKRPHQYWKDFFAWLQHDGLGIVMRWAQEFVRLHGAIEDGQEAPMTERKARMMQDSVLDIDKVMRDVADHIAGAERDGEPRRVLILIRELQAWLAGLPVFHGKHTPATSRIAQALRRAGLTVFDGQDDRPKIKGRSEPLAINFVKMPQDKWPALAESYHVSPADLLDPI